MTVQSQNVNTRFSSLSQMMFFALTAFLQTRPIMFFCVRNMTTFARASFFVFNSHSKFFVDTTPSLLIHNRLFCKVVSKKPLAKKRRSRLRRRQMTNPATKNALTTRGSQQNSLYSPSHGGRSSNAPMKHFGRVF